MVAAGAAVMIEEQELSREPNLLLDTLRNLLADSTALQSMREKARTQANPAAAERIADRLVSLVQRQ
jgi:UDP-N-acetylglucosamine--N-acetylmuramyl-(pentapeptide) pyrophosphoryl-undecaprenol N-acetylglucosamine transferase